MGVTITGTANKPARVVLEIETPGGPSRAKVGSEVIEEEGGDASGFIFDYRGRVDPEDDKEEKGYEKAFCSHDPDCGAVGGARSLWTHSRTSAYNSAHRGGRSYGSGGRPYRSASADRGTAT